MCTTQSRSARRPALRSMRRRSRACSRSRPSSASDRTGTRMLRRELGRGFTFPIQIDARGRFSFSEGQQKVAEAIRVILETRVGERVMRSRFGSEVPAILFEPATSSTADRLAAAIRSALVRWEARIDVLDVEVTSDHGEMSRFIASLTYRLRENNALLNQVYPFYLREGSEDQ